MLAVGKGKRNPAAEESHALQQGGSDAGAASNALDRAKETLNNMMEETEAELDESRDRDFRKPHPSRRDRSALSPLNVAFLRNFKAFSDRITTSIHIWHYFPAVPLTITRRPDSGFDVPSRSARQGGA